MDLGCDRYRRDPETGSQYFPEHPHRGTHHHRSICIHELDVHVSVNDVGDEERAGGGGPLGGPSPTVLDGLRDTARRSVVDLRMRPERSVQRVQTVLRRWQGGPCTASLQLRAYREDDTGRGGDLSGHTRATVPAAG